MRYMKSSKSSLEMMLEYYIIFSQMLNQKLHDPHTMYCTVDDIIESRDWAWQEIEKLLPTRWLQYVENEIYQILKP